MYTRNNNCPTPGTSGMTLAPAVTLTIFLCLVFPFLLEPAPEPGSEIHSYQSDRGLKIKILKSRHIPFIHAQLVIYYREKTKNPAIPYLTFLNIFDRNIRGADTNLLTTLKKLGNDFEVEHRPDFLLFKINFLPDKQQSFIKFLKILYSYKPFLDFDSTSGAYVDQKRKLSTQERFKDSVSNYWNHFFKKKDWKSQLAYQIAYHHFFPGQRMGQSLITPKHLESVQLEHLLSFYQETYQLSNSFLVIKGNIDNPAILNGLIKRAFISFKKQSPLKPPNEEKIPINPREKILIFNTNNDESPVMYWFEAVSASKSGNPVSSLVLNNILFALPTGRIFINSRLANINILGIQTEMVNHSRVSLICNTIRPKYSDIGKFIMLADKEREKLQIKRVERREFLNTLSNIIQQLKVNTQDYENEINLEIVKTEDYTQKVTLASLNQLSEDSNPVVIVILGSARTILPQLAPFRSKVEVIDFNL